VLIDAGRGPHPFVFFRDGAGAPRLVKLDRDRAVLGRAPGSDIEIAWDPRVSAVHARLERHGPRWVIEDDGLSRNGTFLNGKRIKGQRALGDGDVVQVGDTLLGFGDPGPRVPATVTVPKLKSPHISAAQRRVLVALCRPLVADGAGVPATNEQITRELVLSLPTVKGHLRVLFARFGLDGAPQNQKRLLLAERAVASGIVSAVDLE
jgi:pSer/pThr/pTyr-binding forkhead associated (FHA) protein